VGVVRPAQVRESAPRPRRPRLRVQGDTEPPRKRGKGSPFSNSIWPRESNAGTLTGPASCGRN